MPKSWSPKDYFRTKVVFFDLVILILFGIWILGGISFQGHLYLKHGADPRRAAVALAVAGYIFSQKLREESVILKLAVGFGKLLERTWFRWSLFAGMLAGSILLSWYQALALRVTLYDVGIFHQILWSITHGLGFHSTVSDAGDFLKDHFSPTLGLLAPFFSLAHDSPFFFPVVQNVLIFLGAGAWIFLASRAPEQTQEFRQKLAGATTVFILGFDSLWKNLRWGFHENVIAFTTLSWGLALLFTSKNEGLWLRGYLRKSVVLVLMLIAALSKETLLLNMGLALLVWAFLEWQQNRKELQFEDRAFIFFLGICSVWLLSGFIAFETMPHPADKNYFDRYYAYLGHSLSEFSHTLMKSPGFIIREIGAKELLKYLMTVFLPWLFLPFLAFVPRNGKSPYFSPIWLVAIVPSFASAALSTFPLLRRPEFHYVLELWPLLAVMTILALSQKKSTQLIWAWAVFSLFRLDSDPIADFKDFTREAQQTTPVREFLLQIPQEASVVADEVAGPWVTNRKWITRWPDTSIIPNQCPDIVVVRFSESGTLTEIGVQSLITRCRSSRGEPKLGADMKVPVAYWRNGVWSAYRVAPKIETRP